MQAIECPFFMLLLTTLDFRDVNNKRERNVILHLFFKDIYRESTVFIIRCVD